MCTGILESAKKKYDKTSKGQVSKEIWGIKCKTAWWPQLLPEQFMNTQIKCFIETSCMEVGLVLSAARNDLDSETLNKLHEGCVSFGLISLFISLQKKCAHAYDGADVWEGSAFAHPEHFHCGTSWTYKSMYREYSKSFSCHFWVICLVIRRTWCRTNTKQSHEDLNYLHRDGSEHSRLLELLWGMRTGALQLPQWVHFPLTQEAMAMAFTHQCLQRCATILGWNGKINNVFWDHERGEGGALWLLHSNESWTHHALFEPPPCSVCVC